MNEMLDVGKEENRLCFMLFSRSLVIAVTGRWSKLGLRVYILWLAFNQKVAAQPSLRANNLPSCAINATRHVTLVLLELLRSDAFVRLENPPSCHRSRRSAVSRSINNGGTSGLEVPAPPLLTLMNQELSRERASRLF